MATAEQNIQKWLAENPNATSAEIVREANKYNVTPELFSKATGTDLATAQQVKTTVDQLEKTYGTYLDREADLEGLNYWTEQVNSGALTLDQAKLAIATSSESKNKDPVKAATAEVYSSVLQRAPDDEGLEFWSNEIKTAADAGTDPNDALRNAAQAIANSEEKKTQNINKVNNLITRATEGDLGAYGEFLYLARKSDIPVQEELIEQIGYGSTDDKTSAYNYSVGAQAYAEGLEALDQARASGDTAKITELESALTNPQGFFEYYSANVADKEGQAHINLRKETADGNPFEIGDPGEYQTSFFERIGDVGQDILENPVFQMALALNPATAPFAPFIGALTTKLSGDEISGLQVAGMLASAPGAFDQASTLAGTKYNTGMFSPQSVDLFSQQAGLEPNWFTLGEDVASGITTESDLLRGAQQGGVSAAAQALSGASDTDQLMAFINKQMVDLGGLDIPFTDINVGDVKGMLSGIEIPGLNVSLGDLPNYKLPGFDVALGDIPDFKIPGLDLSLNEINTIAGNFPDFNLPTGSLPFDVNLPEFATNFGDINIPNIDIPNINIPNIDIPNVNVPSFETPTFEMADVNIDIPDITLPNIRFSLPQLGGYTQFGVDSPIVRGGRGLFAGDDEEVQRISELLLAGLPQIGGAGS